jgi:D-glycero-alpha-D-manno-heptose-7-phosphate kinase
MLIAQGPLRISLFGGGSDLPAFLERNDGAVLSFAINQRVYIVGHPFTHRRGILLKYSKSEDVQSASQLRHPIAKVVLERYGLTDIDIAVMADVPAGTGMGSSSSFTVAFLAFVRHASGIPSSPVDLALEACEIEIEILREPIGYQDQWASAIGGINVIRFDGNSGVAVEQVTASAETIQLLEQNLHLVPVGDPRSASELLARQGESLTDGSKAEQITRRMVDLVEQGHRALLTNLDDLGPLLHEAWSLKREVSQGVSTPSVDEVYDRGRRSGATGGKLLGAGGSGYLAFYVPRDKVACFTEQFPTELPFRISSRGAGVIHES